MRKAVVLLWGVCLLPAAGPAQAVEHQRVGVQLKTEHRWDLGMSLDLVPWDSSQWEAVATPRLAYEYGQTWSVHGAVPFRWFSSPDAPSLEGHWGQPSVGLSWTGASQQPRWKTGATLTLPPPWEPQPGPWVLLGEVGASLVLDPTILAAVTSLSLPLPGTLSPLLPSTPEVGVTLSFQEVVNDVLVWSLSLSPHLTLATTPAWTFTASWVVGWYQLPFSATAGVSSGTGSPWTWSASGGRSW